MALSAARQILFNDRSADSPYSQYIQTSQRLYYGSATVQSPISSTTNSKKAKANFWTTASRFRRVVWYIQPCQTTFHVWTHTILVEVRQLTDHSFQWRNVHTKHHARDCPNARASTRGGTREWRVRRHSDDLSDPKRFELPSLFPTITLTARQEHPYPAVSYSCVSIRPGFLFSRRTLLY